MPEKIKIPLIKPDLPHPEEWACYLKTSYETRTFCNFGPAVVNFQKALRNYLGLPHDPLTICNATLGLELVLRGLDIRGNVLIPSFTFAATAHSVLQAGANPVLVDANEENWHLSLHDAQRKVTNKTQAIVVVDTLGSRPNPEPYIEFARVNKLHLIFDSAAAFGAKYPGDNQTPGIAQIYSFHVTKTMGIGEGAMVFCPDRDLQKRVQTLSNFGLDENSVVLNPGTNAKMSDFQAAVGLACLAKLPEKIGNRRNCANKYLELLNSRGASQAQPFPSTDNHAFPMFPIRYLGNTEQLESNFMNAGVGFRRYYIPLHWHPLFMSDNPYADSFPIADKLGSSVYCLPCYEDLTEEQQNTIVDCIK